MLHFKEEGDFEPLGSIGSLYDILREADETYEPLEHTSAPVSRPPTKPKPTHLSQPHPHPASSDTQSTKLIPTTQETRPSEHSNPDQKEKPSLNHVKSNGTPPQAAEVVSKAKGRRRGRRAVPALEEGQSIMDKFQNMGTSPLNSQEWDESRLV